MPTRTVLAFSLTALGLPAAAQQPVPETQETMASEAETASVNETLAKIGCEAQSVEKESADLFEVDDATCEIGQYDIKLDGEFVIISMTRDF
jgi:hypothetical protein